ncbi:hypothetical protein CR513_18159, partial [Mucuna pruriens]
MGRIKFANLRRSYMYPWGVDRVKVIISFFIKYYHDSEHIFLSICVNHIIIARNVETKRLLILDKFLLNKTTILEIGEESPTVEKSQY